MLLMDECYSLARSMIPCYDGVYLLFLFDLCTHFPRVSSCPDFVSRRWCSARVLGPLFDQAQPFLLRIRPTISTLMTCSTSILSPKPVFQPHPSVTYKASAYLNARACFFIPRKTYSQSKSECKSVNASSIRAVCLLTRTLTAELERRADVMWR